MNYDEKLKKEQEVRLGQLNNEWMAKIGQDFFETETNQILKELRFAMTPNELVLVQARYRVMLDLQNRLGSIGSKMNSSAKKLRDETRRG